MKTEGTTLWQPQSGYVLVIKFNGKKSYFKASPGQPSKYQIMYINDEQEANFIDKFYQVDGFFIDKHDEFNKSILEFAQSYKESSFFPIHH